MFMRTLPVVMVAALLSGCRRGNAMDPHDSAVANASPNSAVPATQIATTQNDQPLPIVFATKLHPIKEAARFVDVGYLKYLEDHDQRQSKEEPFEKDADAIAAARNWITSHFRLPADTSLEVTKLDRSSSGRPAPAFNWDRGHTIQFSQKYKGLTSDGHAVIYLTGRNKFAASITLYSFEPVPETAKQVIAERAAMDAIVSKFGRDMTEGEGSEKLAKNWHLKLSYVWSPHANKIYGRDDIDVLAPTWIINGETRICVDGHTGKAWVND